MHRFVLFFAFFLASYAHGASLPQIVGGTDAPLGKYPYLVSLRRNGIHFCGGSIVNQRYVLTAAHCVDTTRASEWMVHAATVLNNATGDAYNVERIIRHESFMWRTAENDIALLRVARDIEYNDIVKPTVLDTTNFVQEGDIAELSGWGSFQRFGRSSYKLQEVTIKIVSLERCQRTYPKVTERQICTSTADLKGACNGDSGGPLVVNGVQVGVLSFGPCATGNPDAFTRVYSYQDWIQENMK